MTRGYSELKVRWWREDEERMEGGREEVEGRRKMKRG
jgi:hypothetical protein